MGGWAHHKKAITLDIRNAEERDTLKDLVRISDVLVHNFARGSPHASHLTYESLAAINPSTVGVDRGVRASRGVPANAGAHWPRQSRGARLRKRR